jgi:hypothetical protein
MNMNANIDMNDKLLQFWTLYDNYGITQALNWLEHNKYSDIIDKSTIDDLSSLMNNVNINKNST